MKRIPPFLLSILCLIAMLTACDTKKYDLRHMIMVHGVLYVDTERQIPVEIAPSAVLGTVTSTVDSSETPTKNSQANFDCPGTEYAYYEDGLAVLYNNEWIYFMKGESQ